MTYFLALFIPPLYFLVKKKYGAAILHGILWFLAIPLLFVFGVGFIPWLISAVCAVWHLRKQIFEVHATMIATKMAETMRRPDGT